MEYKNKLKEYNTILSDLNENLEGLVDRLKGDITKQNNILNPITADMPQSCGSIEKNSFKPYDKMSAEDLQDVKDAEFGISEIKEELLTNKIDFPDGESLVPSDGGIGEGKGVDIGFMELPELEGGEPEWFSEIEAGLGDLIGTPKMGRKYIDYEGAQTYLEQGVAVFRKAKNKVIKNDLEKQKIK